ncbi:unnamed protein product, partial [marine sediment metagenome]
GGLYGSYESSVDVNDCIIWGNLSTFDGSQIAVGSGDLPYPLPATVNVTHSCIEPDVNDPNAIGVSSLDLVFAIDSTASMGLDIDALKAAAVQIVGLVGSSMPDYRIAVVDYRDFNEPNTTYGAPGDYPYRTDAPFTRDPAAVIAGLNPIVAGGGADLEESVYAGLMHCIDHGALAAALGGNLYGADPASLGPGPWRTGDVSRVIILMGDAPPHDPEPFTGYTHNTIVAAATAFPAPKRIFTIPVRGYPATVASFSALA